MASLGVFLSAAAGPIAKRVLASLGMGFISFAALTTAVNAVVDAARASYGSMSGSMLQISDLLGIGTAIGIILGGIVARASFAAASRLGKLS